MINIQLVALWLAAVTVQTERENIIERSEQTRRIFAFGNQLWEIFFSESSSSGEWVVKKIHFDSIHTGSGIRATNWEEAEKEEEDFFLKTFNVDEAETYCDKCASGFLTAEPGLDSDER